MLSLSLSSARVKKPLKKNSPIGVNSLGAWIIHSLDDMLLNSGFFSEFTFQRVQFVYSAAFLYSKGNSGCRNQFLPGTNLNRSRVFSFVSCSSEPQCAPSQMFKSCSSTQELKTSRSVCMVTSVSAKMRVASCVRSFLAEDGLLSHESPSLGIGQCQVQTHRQIIIIIIKWLQRKSGILWLWDHGGSECNFRSISLVFPWNSPGSGMHEAFWLTDLLCFWLKKKIEILRNMFMVPVS